MRYAKTKNDAEVGIVFLVEGKLWIDATPVTEAANYGDFKIHERGHERYWEELVHAGAVPECEYKEHPRGRVAYNTKTGKYLLLVDECILKKKGVVRNILSRMRLHRDIVLGTDRHYRCSRCLGRTV